MRALDAALGVFAEEAHIALAGLAIWAGVRAANGRHDEVAGREALHPLPHRVNDAERLVADDEHVRTGRRFAVLAVVDFGVGAVNPTSSTRMSAMPVSRRGLGSSSCCALPA